MTGKRAPTEIRFLEKFVVCKPNECWPWSANTNGMGYGLLWDLERRRKVLAHRYAYERHHGVTLPPGNGTVVMHTCDNPGCVNPAHLRLGTMLTNAQDMDRKGRRRTVVCPTNKPPRMIGSHHARAKLTEELVVLYRQQLANGKPLRQLAREAGVNAAVMRRMRDRKTWAHVP